MQQMPGPIPGGSFQAMNQQQGLAPMGQLPPPGQMPMQPPPQNYGGMPQGEPPYGAMPQGQPPYGAMPQGQPNMGGVPMGGPPGMGAPPPGGLGGPGGSMMNPGMQQPQGMDPYGAPPGAGGSMGGGSFGSMGDGPPPDGGSFGGGGSMGGPPRDGSGFDGGGGADDGFGGGPPMGDEPMMRSDAVGGFGGDAGGGPMGAPGDPQKKKKGLPLTGYRAYITFCATVVGTCLIAAACVGTPWCNIPFVTIDRKDADQVYSIGLFGDCLTDNKSNLQQCASAGFGFELHGFGLDESNKLKTAISKGGTFFFFLPVCTVIAGFLSVISDNTHLALFYSLLASTVLAGASVLSVLITFTDCINKINDRTKLEAKSGPGQILVIIGAILIFVAMACAWCPEAWQTCHPSHDVLGADDGRNEKQSLGDPWAVARGKYDPPDPFKQPGGGGRMSMQDAPPPYGGSMGGPAPGGGSTKGGMGSFGGDSGAPDDGFGGGEGPPGGGDSYGMSSDMPRDGGDGEMPPGGPPGQDPYGADPYGQGLPAGGMGAAPGPPYPNMDPMAQAPQEGMPQGAGSYNSQAADDYNLRAAALRNAMAARGNRSKAARSKTHKHKHRKETEAPTDYALKWMKYNQAFPGWNDQEARSSVVVGDGGSSRQDEDSNQPPSYKTALRGGDGGQGSSSRSRQHRRH